MTAVVCIGDDALEGFVLAGVDVLVANSEPEIVAAWESLDDDVGLVILSARASRVLSDELDRHPARLSVVVP